jgi:hypothetical protein
MKTRSTRSSVLASWLMATVLLLGACEPREIHIAINPPSATVAAEGSFVFTAQVSGADDPSVSWSVPGTPASGTISNSGVYTAPKTPGTYQVMATSLEDVSKTATASVVVTATNTVSITLSPNPVTVQTDEKQTFTATVTGTPERRVTWSVQEGASGGTVNTEGTYTAPSRPGTYHLVATSVADPQVRDIATVTVTYDYVPSVSISPATPSAVTNQFLPLTGRLHGVYYSAELEWSVIEQSGGGVTCRGTYLAPSQPGVYHVAAAHETRPGLRALATVDVSDARGPAVWVFPRGRYVPSGGKQTFSASVSGAANKEITWSIREGAAGGTITPEGLYTAPVLPNGTDLARFTVVATSKADPSRSAEALVDVVRPDGELYSLAINPSTLRLRPGAAASLSATLSYYTGVGYGSGVGYGPGVYYAPNLRWRILEAGGGTVSTSGAYFAPNTPGTYHVAAEAEGCVADGFVTVTVE